MVYFPAYIRLPGIYTCHVEKKPIYQLLESQQRDASKVRTLPIGLTPRTTGRPGRQKLRVLFATYKSWPVRAMQKEKKSIPYLCHLQKTRHPNFALFPRNCLRQRHQWPFHNLLSTSVFYERPYRTPEKHIYIYIIRFQVRSKLDPTQKTGGQHFSSFMLGIFLAQVSVVRFSTWKNHHSLWMSGLFGSLWFHHPAFQRPGSVVFGRISVKAS